MNEPIVHDGEVYPDEEAFVAATHPDIPEEIKRIYVGPKAKEDKPAPDTAAGMALQATEKAADALKRAQATPPTVDSDTGIDGPVNITIPWLRKALPNLDSNITQGDYERAQEIALSSGAGVIHDPTIAGPLQIIREILGGKKANEPVTLTPEHETQLQRTVDFWDAKEAEWRAATKATFGAEEVPGTPEFNKKYGYDLEQKPLYIDPMTGQNHGDVKPSWWDDYIDNSTAPKTSKPAWWDYEQMGSGKYEIFDANSGKTHAVVDSQEAASKIIRSWDASAGKFGFDENFKPHYPPVVEPHIVTKYNSPVEPSGITHVKINEGPLSGEESWSGSDWSITKPADPEATKWVHVDPNGKHTFLSKKSGEALVKSLELKPKESFYDSFTTKAMNEIEQILNAMDKEDAAQKAGVKIPITESKVNPQLHSVQEPLYYHEKTATWEYHPEEIEKLSPKEAFKKGVIEASMKFKTAVDNIRSGFKEVTNEPKLQPPKVKGVGNYTEAAYKGMQVNPQEGVNPVFDFKKAYGEIYSSASPRLAEMYSHMSGKPPGYAVPEGHFGEGSTVVPLLIDTSKYLTYDAKGQSYVFVNDVAIEKAKKEGYLGVKMINVHDEPANTTHLPPQTVYITLPKGAHTVKSRFAQKFDPSSPNMLHVIPAIGATGAAGTVAFDLSSEQNDEKQN